MGFRANQMDQWEKNYNRLEAQAEYKRENPSYGLYVMNINSYKIKIIIDLYINNFYLI